jgi:hypothetical protein
MDHEIPHRGKSIGGLSDISNACRRVPNRLPWARRHGGRSAVPRLFLDGRNLGDIATPVEIGGATALNEIVADDRNARRLGVNAVPRFMFRGQNAISGADLDQSRPRFFIE